MKINKNYMLIGAGSRIVINNHISCHFNLYLIEFNIIINNL